jgi:hypothetical protein
MEQNVMVENVMPYIVAWSFLITLILGVITLRSWKFGRQHPEIFKPDTTAEDLRERQQKAELRRQYNNQSMLFFSLVFIWVIGTVAISLRFLNSATTTMGWKVIAISGLAIVWILSMVQRKSKP